MMDAAFRPILYLKANCPHCFKVRLFLTEASLIAGFDVREFAPGDTHESAIRAELAPHFGKLGFPTVQFEAGVYMAESDVIIDHYAEAAGIDPVTLPLTRTWREVIQPRLQRLKRENADLQTRLDAAETTR